MNFDKQARKLATEERMTQTQVVMQAFHPMPGVFTYTISEVPSGGRVTMALIRDDELVYRGSHESPGEFTTDVRLPFGIYTTMLTTEYPDA